MQIYAKLKISMQTDQKYCFSMDLMYNVHFPTTGGAHAHPRFDLFHNPAHRRLRYNATYGEQGCDGTNHRNDFQFNGVARHMRPPRNTQCCSLRVTPPNARVGVQSFSGLDTQRSCGRILRWPQSSPSMARRTGRKLLPAIRRVRMTYSGKPDA